ncbi:MAG: hypothetical protein JWR69_1073 [Pedosphaera sp.]|nr:hypothetical protein [Pedosphaera sp.]
MVSGDLHTACSCILDYLEHQFAEGGCKLCDNTDTRTQENVLVVNAHNRTVAAITLAFGIKANRVVTNVRPLAELNKTCLQQHLSQALVAKISPANSSQPCPSRLGNKHRRRKSTSGQRNDKINCS